MLEEYIHWIADYGIDKMEGLARVSATLEAGPGLKWFKTHEWGTDTDTLGRAPGILALLNGGLRPTDVHQWVSPLCTSGESIALHFACKETSRYL